MTVHENDDVTFRHSTSNQSRLYESEIYWIPTKFDYFSEDSLHVNMKYFSEIIWNITLWVNPLWPIGSPVTHENLPTNWPNFAASPALLGWPARNRHTAACINRFSHILRWPPEPVVWFMSESRAVANDHEGYKRTLSIISSSFWMAVGLKGLLSYYNSNYIML